jgi:type VI secretion system protein VasG
MSQILLSAHARDERYRRVEVRCEQGEFVCQFAV